jgi:hypothetical protein
MRALPLLILLLSACNRSPDVPTAAENRDLDEAAAMLDGADDALAGTDANALGPVEPGNEVEP